MFSKPPARTTGASPSRIIWAAWMSAQRPDPHAMLTVTPGRSTGTPARTATWRPGFGPSPAWRAQPKIAASTLAAGSPAAQEAGRGRDAEVDGGDVGKLPQELADRRPDGMRDDDGVGL